MKHPSLYLDWYVRVPNVKYDFRSSGLAYFRHDINLGEVDISVNYDRGNPEALNQIARWYGVKPENVFVSSEGASGQNARVIRCLAERNPKKTEAIVEFPTYEPLLRAAQEHFRTVKRLVRCEKDNYRLDADQLRKKVSEKTGLLVITNPQAPTGAIADRNELKEITDVANEDGFYVLCDEIYAEFDRKTVPTLFLVDPEVGITTTSFTKAYGLGGLKLGTALVREDLVNELYTDVVNTVGNTPNVLQIAAAKLLADGKGSLERHKHKWTRLKKETEKWMAKVELEHYPSRLGVAYWVKLPVRDTHKWINEETIPKYSLAMVPGAFFLFKNDYTLATSDMIRLGIGGINPDSPILHEALSVLERSLKQHKAET